VIRRSAADCREVVGDFQARDEVVARIDFGHGLGVLERARVELGAQVDHGTHAVAEAEAPADAVAVKVVDRGAV